MSELLELPLKDLHESLGAKFGEFAGWNVPLVFSSAIEEHLSVRKDKGLFDVTHMGRIIIKGEDAKDLLDYLLTKNVKKLTPGKILIPVLMLNEKAGIIDDISLFMLKEKEFLIVCNAINRFKNIDWIKQNAKKHHFNIEIEDITENTVMLALQGKDVSFIEEKINIERGNFLQDVKLYDINIKLISKSGWTGENGFEIITDINEGRELWKKLISIGIKPCGIIARDTLRLEAGFLLYGNEINENIDPIKARYWAFSLKKDDYIGKDILTEIIKRGVDEFRIGLIMKDKGPIPRKQNEICIDDIVIGCVTSGGYSPILNRGIAMGYIRSNYYYEGGSLFIKIRNNLYEAKVVEPPFHKYVY